MKKSELADKLRERQVEIESVEIKRQLDEIKDEAMINRQITCDCCGENMVSDEELAKAISDSHTLDEFFIIIENIAEKDSSKHNLN